MIHYGGATPKRHVAWSNVKEVGRLHTGKYSAKRAGAVSASKTYRNYLGKDGKRKYVGTKDLKKTQKLGDLVCSGLIWAVPMIPGETSDGLPRN